MSELVFNRVILEKNNQILALVAVISVSVNLLFMLVLIATINKKPLVVYEDSGQVRSLKKNDFKLDERILEGFVRMVTKEYFSFTAVSLPMQVEGIKQYLAEGPKESILKSYKKNERKLQEENVFHQYSIYGIDLTKKSSPFLVDVQGIKTIYANGNSKNTRAAYEFEIQKVPQSEENPYGLIVSRITEIAGKKKEAKEPPKVEIKKKSPPSASRRSGKKKGESKVSKIAPLVLKESHVTEKSTDLKKENQYVFKVYRKANKDQIKKAI